MTLASADLPGAILLDANLTGVSLDLAKGPVVGKPVCYFADCRHWQGGSGAHPGAADKPRPRRRR